MKINLILANKFVDSFSWNILIYDKRVEFFGYEQPSLSSERLVFHYDTMAFRNESLARLESIKNED